MTEEQMGGGPQEEELRRQLEEQMRRIRVEEVLVQTAVTLVNLGARRLGLGGEASERDLGQARLAIEGARALLPVLPEDVQQAVREGLSQLQLAFAREAREGAGAAPGAGAGPEAGAAPQAGARAEAGAGAPGPGAQQPAGDRAAAEEAERAKARAKIWTPPGSGA